MPRSMASFMLAVPAESVRYRTDTTTFGVLSYQLLSAGLEAVPWQKGDVSEVTVSRSIGRC